MTGNSSDGTQATRSRPVRHDFRRWALGVCVVLACAGAAYWWWHAGRVVVPVPPVLPEIEEWTEPAVSAPGYLGVDACAPCHNRRVAEFRSTRHYLACRVPTPGAMPSGFLPGRGHFTAREPRLHFEMTERDGEFFQTAIWTEDASEQRTAARIALAYGSGGGLDEVYFTWHGDRLYELPMVWLHPHQRFAIISHNPYGAGGDYSRETTTRCLECHNTWFEHAPGTRNQYKREHVILGVTCEKCHGPGREHVAYHQAHTDAEAGQAIVNPSRLARERLLEVCTQCHSNAIRPRTRAFAYRPGEPLDEYFKTITTQVPDNDHVANQVQYLRQSKCFQKSEMTCTTCHNPHRPHQAGKPGSSERACFQCHKPADCAAQERLPVAVRDDCTGCHMPRRIWMNVYFHTEDDQYLPPIRRYQHRIGIYLEGTQEVLLAWYRTQSDATSKQEAARLTRALGDYWLAEAQKRRRDYRFLAAIGAFREALWVDGSDDARAGLRETVKLQAELDAELVKGMHEIDERRFDTAVVTLKKVLAIKPDVAIAHGKLGAAYAALGQNELAVKHLRAVSVHDPNEPYGEMMLGWLAYLDGRTDEAVEAYRRADELEPFNAKTHYHWALARAKADRLIEAARHFRQVLLIAPNHVGACQGLGNVLRRQGEPVEAIRFARRADRLSGHENAEILLELAEAYAASGRYDDAAIAGGKAFALLQARSPVTAAPVRRRLEEWRALAKQARR
jgi:tetratricopeptide (TPR) repeat protein